MQQGAVATPAKRVRHLKRALKRLVGAAGSLPASVKLEPLANISAADAKLSAASLAVVHQYWRASDTPGADAAIELAERHPACRSVAEMLRSAKASAINRAALEVANEITNAATTESAVDPLIGFVEQLIAVADETRRRDLGVYFTPQPATEYLIRRTDEVLRESFGCQQGLRSETIKDGSDRPLRMLDPAAGSGIFLITLVRRIRQLQCEVAADGESWSSVVSDSLLHRMAGCEILPAAFVVANHLLAMELVASGYSPQAGDRLPLSLGDCLAPAAEAPKPFNAVIGNPPYRGSSTNAHPWITRLLKGKGPDGENAVSYFHVDGHPLGERKTWLHDDYVKFFRFAQWQIEQSGSGLIALVTNHGFLDNPTFRGMRAGLCETFSNIEVIDLHGNVKRGHVHRKGAADDESLFETAQGMALTVAWRGGGASGSPQMTRGDLMGSRVEKLSVLAADGRDRIQKTIISPTSPNYFFSSSSNCLLPEYEAAMRLPDVMPLHTTAAVTARDWFVIDTCRNRLNERLEDFADLSICDDDIRARYFQRTRSSKYPPGDTRGWKLPEARRRLADEPNWQRHIRTCLYRPFDRRWIFWTPWMVDWPRRELMEQLSPDNFALVCRRQSVPGQPANFFWVADDIVIDGYIRSDNRGSESVFPCVRTDGEKANSATPNFSDAVLAACEHCGFDTTDLPHYIYALFHATGYRQQYADALAIDFPRLFLPKAAALYRALSAVGRDLVATHLLHEPLDSDTPVRYFGDDNPIVALGYPKRNGQDVMIDGGSGFGPIAQQAWELRVGAHQVVRKWLKDRRGHVLNQEDITTYRRIVAAVNRTLQLKASIDRTFDNAGGWPDAFDV